MNTNYCSPLFQFENRPPLKDYTSNVDNIKQAKNRIAELQNIIHELNKSHAKQSTSPLAKSPIRIHTPIEYNQFRLPTISRYCELDYGIILQKNPAHVFRLQKLDKGKSEQ